MWKVVVKDVHPDLNGSYELDWEFKKKHWRTMKRVADVTPLELVKEMKRGNVELHIALCMIALDQAGKAYIEEMLWETDGDLQIVEEKDPDARPPDEQKSRSLEESNESSGLITRSDGELSQETTTGNGSGTPDSVTPPTSVLSTSES